MEVLILRPENKAQLSALKAMAKALKISFETKNDVYAAEFVDKIEKSKQEVKEGKTTRVKKEDLQKFLGL
ncbi:MAG: hypothetical protein EOO89_01805 [Pedobacter sp.]|nr:MAG: hypothetical protein EOO89_01805 [Pedobacter sp.]